MKKIFYKWIFFRLMRWKIEGAVDDKIKKSVLMVMPHTSWHDFYIGLLTRGILQLEINWVGKKELFRFPFGLYFRYMGGVPLDRSEKQNKVNAIVEVFKKRKVFRIAIAPEGTRKKVNELKTGFYFIALQANVPIIAVAFDFRTKTVRISKPFYPSGNLADDLKILGSHFIGVHGRIPEKGFGESVFL